MSKISQLSNSLSVAVSNTVTVTLSPPSLPQLLHVLQQPNHRLCHIILWLVGAVPFSTNSKGGVTCFFVCKHFLLVGTFVREVRFDRLFLQQTWRRSLWKSVADIIVSPVLLGLSTRFKNWYIVWRPCKHISRHRGSLRLRLAAKSS